MITDGKSNPILRIIVLKIKVVKVVNLGKIFILTIIAEMIQIGRLYII